MTRLKKKIQKAKQPEEQGSNSLVFGSVINKQVSINARLFLFVVMSLFAFSTQSQGLKWSLPSRKAHNLICQYRLDEAAEILSNEPQSAEKAYLLNLSDLLQMAYSDDGALYEHYLNELPARKSWIEALPADDNGRAFYLADMKLQEALFKVKFGDNLSGLYSLWQANNQVSEMLKAESYPPSSLKLAGTLNILIGLTPEKYRWATALIGLNGSISKGIEQLTQLSESSSPLAREALMILGYFYAYPLQEPDKATGYFRRLLTSEPSDGLARFMLATSLSKCHQGRAALDTLLPTNNAQRERMPTIYYLLGDLYLQKGELAEARNAYESFLHLYRGNNFRKDVLSKISASYYLEHDMPQALFWKTRAEQIVNTSTEPDKNARVFIAELTDYPPPLLKARFCTDGGYWAEAEKELLSVQPATELSGKWLCDYYYRMGRLYHLQNKSLAAIPHYEKALVLADHQPWYMGANAALQLGILLKEQNKTSEAVGYFEKAKSFENHPYKASIDARADRELASLGLKQ